jgi:integrase
VFGMKLYKLNQSEINRAESRAREYTLGDGGGLFLVVKPTGSRTWVWRYLHDGKERKAGLGVFPDVDLKAARREADRLREQLVQTGADPLAAKHQARADARLAERERKHTFKLLAFLWIRRARKEANWSKGHYDRQLALLKNHAFPRLGNLWIRKIDEPLVAGVISDIYESGRKETAGRVRGLIREVFGFACGKIRALDSRDNFMRFGDNIGQIRKPKTRSYPALLEPTRVGKLIRDMRAYQGRGLIVWSALNLLPYLAQRPGQYLRMTWEQVDLKGAIWTCPPQIMKQSTTDQNDTRTWPHKVPLPRQAVKILEQLYALTGPNGLVFPSVVTRARKSGKSISNNTINSALRALGYDTRDEITGHGFRTMLQSISQDDLGLAKVVSDRHLAHKPSGPLSSTYDRATLLPQRIPMIQQYADLLDEWADTQGPGAPHPKVDLSLVDAARAA